MSDRPILFSGPMVRALLDGRKTQTRRVFKLPKKTSNGGPIYERKDMGGWEPTINGGGGTFTIAKDGSRLPALEAVGIWHRTTGICLNAPYQVGDRLWVREAWRTEIAFNNFAPSMLNSTAPIQYEADGARNRSWRDNIQSQDYAGKLRPGIYMPRRASRLALIVNDVRVRRLHDISEADAAAEGVESDSDGWRDYQMPGTQCCRSALASYRTLWDSLNAKRGYGWDANPWVVAISFTVERRNIGEAAQ